MFICNSLCKEQKEDNHQLVVTPKVRTLKSQESVICAQESIETSMVTIDIFQNSNYKRSVQQCIKHHSQFVDSEFPPNENSLNYSVPQRTIVWKRITDIVPDCILIQNGIQNTDVQHGNVEDIYFLPTISAIAKYPIKIQNIFIKNNQLNNEGIYQLIIKENGIPKALIIDDFVPVYKESNRPVFCKSHGREVWVMLVEKAWAKLKGSYGNMLKGYPHQVLTTFCVGPCLSYDLKTISQDKLQKIWQVMVQAEYKHYVMCANSSQKVNWPNLFPKRVFQVIKAYETKLQKLVKIQSYWSNEINKEFTIPFPKFLQNFVSIDISHSNGQIDLYYQIIQSKTPLYLRLQAKQDHKAYLTIQKYHKASVENKNDSKFIRIFIGKQMEQNLQYYQCKFERVFNDCTIQFPSLKKGNYLIKVQSNLGMGNELEKIVLSYYYQNISRNQHLFSINKIQIRNSQAFLEDLLYSHCIHRNTQVNKLGSHRSNDWVKMALLHEECGYGYVACSLDSQTDFHLLIMIDNEAISSNGFRLLGARIRLEQCIIKAGDRKLFIFQPLHHEHEFLQFPPQGFSLKKIK